MTVMKLILIPALVALPLGWVVPYFATSFQGDESFETYKKQVEENIKNRREKICEEVEIHLPENPELAKSAIQNEINAINERKTERRKENEIY